MRTKEKPEADHGTKDVRAALKAIGGEWDDAEVKDFADVPDGKYQVRIDKAEINHSKSSGRLQTSWQMTIASGEYKNRKIFKHDGMVEDQLSYLKTGLARLGIEWPSKPSLLPAALEELLGTYAQVTCKTKEGNDIQNTYFDKALDSDDLEEELDDDDEKDADSDDDGDDEKPAKKGSRAKKDADEDDADTDDDEEEDEKPAKKKKPADDDDDDAGDDDDDSDDKKKDDDDGDDDEKDTDADEDDAETKDEDAEEVTAKFDDKGIDKFQKKTITAMAEKNDFDPDDYNTTTDLICDIAEHVGVKGVFKKSADLIAAIEKKSKKTK